MTVLRAARLLILSAFIFGLCVCTAGCSGTATFEEIAKLNAQCKDHGGVDYYKLTDDGTPWARCKNGIYTKHLYVNGAK